MQRRCWVSTRCTSRGQHARGERREPEQHEHGDVRDRVERAQAVELVAQNQRRSARKRETDDRADDYSAAVDAQYDTDNLLRPSAERHANADLAALTLH